MSWLITGGAGYIGAHVVRAFRAAGEEVVVLDDLSEGMRSKVPEDVPLVVASVLDRPSVDRTLRDHAVHGVVHLAARKAVAESVARPLHYYRENVGGLLTLLEACQAQAVRRFVYSSSASVYGAAGDVPLTEEVPTAPMSPYGATKAMGERLLTDCTHAGLLGHVVLRYFNVAGAGGRGLADPGTANLIPLALRASARGVRAQVFGADYPTPDGTCIRDYVHVSDLADAHLVAARAVGDGPVGRVYNVGRGEGHSVLEVLAVVGEVTGRHLEPEVVARRLGDPPRSVADVARIHGELGWSAAHGLTDMVRSAWEARGVEGPEWTRTEPAS